MTRPEQYSFTRYLEAKRSVDDRALHRPTLDRLRHLLAERPEPVRVVEVGCGTGTMLRRLLRWDVLPDRVVYDGYDLRTEAVETAIGELAAWAPDNGYAVSSSATRSGEPIQLVDDDRGKRVTATFNAADALAFAEAEAGERRCDLLVGCAFVDLVDLDEALPPLLDLVPGGLAYFPITFDGETLFRPVASPATERDVLNVYHATMDEPDRPGGSRTGRELFDALPGAGAEVVAAGGSDWVVTPPYREDEAYFVHHLIDGIEDAVTTALDAGGGGDSGGLAGTDATERLTPAAVASWADERHAAVADGRLTYAAHNFDVLARVGER